MSDKLYPIKGYEGLYAITIDGRVWSYPKNGSGSCGHDGKWLRPLIDKGYARIYLYKNKKRKRVKVHSIVAETFMPNPDCKPDINHLNEIRDDNRVENLEWCTKSENIQHSINKMGAPRTAKVKSKFMWVYWRKDRNKWVARVTKAGKRYHLGYYDNEKEASMSVIAFKEK